jgi:8-oxo-dGTP diphosphatase
MAKDRFKIIPAVYLLLRRNNEVLLLKRANTGYQDGKYSLIAGHLDGDEMAKDAMIREAKEEAGITIDPNIVKLVHVAHRLTRNQPGQERIDLFFEAWSWKGEIENMEPNKCQDLKWFPINDLPKLTIPLIHSVINDLTNRTNYSEFETEPI